MYHGSLWGGLLRYLGGNYQRPILETERLLRQTKIFDRRKRAQSTLEPSQRPVWISQLPCLLSIEVIVSTPDKKITVAGQADLEKAISSKIGDAQSVQEGITSRLSKNPLAHVRKTLLGSAEARGIAPVPVEERTDRSVFSLFTLWFTANCTTLP